MKDEIEVGEYVRDEKGFITKIDSDFVLENIERFIEGHKIIKHSKNIIDLLDVGDYVNGTRIYEMGQTENKEKWIHSINGFLYFNKDIESIVTKEQMASIEYRVEDVK